MRRQALALCLALGSLGVAALAHAQAADPSTAARQAFEEGRAHHEDRRYNLAAEAFQRAYELMVEAGLPNAGVIQFNLATSLDELSGREREARDAYARYLAEASHEGEEGAQRAGVVQARIRELDLRIAAGGSATPSQGAEGSLSPVGPILLGVGGAALVAGLITLGITVAENDAFLAMCRDGVCPTSARASAESVQTLGTVTDVLLISGGAIAAAGLVLTLVLRDAPSDAPAVAAACSADGCHATVGGSF